MQDATDHAELARLRALVAALASRLYAALFANCMPLFPAQLRRYAAVCAFTIVLWTTLRLFTGAM